MEKKMTAIKAIRLKCLDCMGENSALVKTCDIPDCSLFPYRLGKNPACKGRKGNAESLSKARRLALQQRVDKENVL